MKASFCTKAIWARNCTKSNKRVLRKGNAYFQDTGGKKSLLRYFIPQANGVEYYVCQEPDPLKCLDVHLLTAIGYKDVYLGQKNPEMIFLKTFLGLKTLSKKVCLNPAILKCLVKLFQYPNVVTLWKQTCIINELII